MQTLRIILLIGIFILLLIIGFKTHAALAESPTRDVSLCNGLSDIKKYACEQVSYFWSVDHWESFNNIIQHESSWEPTAKNPRTSAYGLCQTMLSLHAVPKDFNPRAQVDWCIDYTLDRYKNPKLAWNHWVIHKNW